MRELPREPPLPDTFRDRRTLPRPQLSLSEVPIQRRPFRVRQTHLHTLWLEEQKKNSQSSFRSEVLRSQCCVRVPYINVHMSRSTDY